MSERKLSKNYETIQSWEGNNGEIKQWIRWDFSKQKEIWLERNQLKEKWLYENLKWMTEGGKIASIRKADESRLYYIVTTQKGEEYYLVFEQTTVVNALVLIFEDHWQNYTYNIALNTLDFDYEVYDCFQNGIDSISFRHIKRKDFVYVNTVIVGGKIDLKISLTYNLPVCKVLNEYHSFFEEISKYNLSTIGTFSKTSQIEIIVKIANMLRKRMMEDIAGFRVIFDCNNEWLDFDSNGVSMKARLCESGNYVICHKDGRTEWLYSTSDYNYKIKDGVIVNWKDEKVTEQKLAKTNISDIRASKSLFYHVKQEFFAD